MSMHVVEMIAVKPKANPSKYRDKDGLFKKRAKASRTHVGRI